MAPPARKRLAIALLVVGVLALVDLLMTVVAINVANYQSTHGTPPPIYPFWPSPLWRVSIGIGFMLLRPQSNDQAMEVTFGALYIAFGIPLLLLLAAFWIRPRQVRGVLVTEGRAPG